MMWCPFVFIAVFLVAVQKSRWEYTAGLGDKRESGEEHFVAMQARDDGSLADQREKPR